MMNTIQILKKVRGVIQKGWTKKRFNDGRGRYCLIGALNRVGFGDPPTRQLLDDIAVAKGFTGAISFNDAQKTKKPVLALIDEAIEVAKKGKK